LAITLLIAILTIKNPAFIDESIETLLLDYRFQIRNLLATPESPDNIVIAAIDEKALQDTEDGHGPENSRLNS